MGNDKNNVISINHRMMRNRAEGQHQLHNYSDSTYEPYMNWAIQQLKIEAKRLEVANASIQEGITHEQFLNQRDLSANVLYFISAFRLNFGNVVKLKHLNLEEDLNFISDYCVNLLKDLGTTIDRYQELIDRNKSFVKTTRAKCGPKPKVLREE